ncbi:hypothetical protein PCANC_13458 [Puccinia coronata f. sp. avenae]|uniref:Uncharacterized protein n=1 Tax=Puccinia coronata f. sp. avenae TaxID=200324 RepID=A0A2N5SR89_9BASI|nr:hypothetical protein PCANC_13458 [Puccinia coronata f. sp. avenae]
MMSFSTTPHGSTYPFLLTVQRFPALPSSTGNPTTQLIAVSSSANKPHQVLVQHFHPPSPSRQARLPHDSYLVDLHGSTEYPQPAGAITAIELTVTNRAALSPCLVFGTANGSLYLTRSDFSRPHSKLKQLHRSRVIGLASCPLATQPTLLISASSAELLLWDLDDRRLQPTCLRAFGRQNPTFIANPYSSILVGVQFRRISTEQVSLLAEFEDGLVSCWNLQGLLGPETSQPTAARVFSVRHPKYLPLLDVCCASPGEERFHVFTVDPHNGWVQQSETGRKLFQLNSPVSRLLCTRYDWSAQKIELLALFRETQELMKIDIDDSPHLESPGVTMTKVESDCAFFHYDRVNGWLVTCKSTNHEMAIREMDQSIRWVQSHNIDSQAHLKRSGTGSAIKNVEFLTLGMIQGAADSEISDAELVKLLRDELDQRFKFPAHLRLAIYKRMLVQSKQQEDDLTATYYRYLARSSPETFLKKFRAAWKLEEAGFQFSLETLLSIFHGMGTYSEASLVDKLAPILYSFLKILESAEEVIMSRAEDRGGEDPATELVEIYKVCRLMLKRFGDGAFGEKSPTASDRKLHYDRFVLNVSRRLAAAGSSSSSTGSSLLDHFTTHSISMGKDCLPHLTHGFLMGFCSPGSFESLMDHLVIGHSGLISLTDLCVKLLAYFSPDIVGLPSTKDIQEPILRECTIC